MFHTIFENDIDDFQRKQLAYDPGNESQESLVSLCKEIIGYAPIATNQDMFDSVIRVYTDAKRKAKLNTL